FNPNRVEKILKQIDIGPDLTQEQRAEVMELVAEFADIFTTSLKEVLPIDFIKHKLTIDPTVKLPTR
ncbi:hypothetical protein BOTBODRAFT_76812, partial [Botryobasidium botryosum FD-172 SS1]